MLKKLTRKHGDKDKEAARDMLSLEVAEISEISEKLFLKLEARMKSLAAVEERMDRKISHLEDLLLKAEKIQPLPQHLPDDRHLEISKLVGKGLKVDEIAGILDMPRGEVELILSLRK